jgi:hypothetical protein
MLPCDCKQQTGDGPPIPFAPATSRGSDSIEQLNCNCPPRLLGVVPPPLKHCGHHGFIALGSSNRNKTRDTLKGNNSPVELQLAQPKLQPSTEEFQNYTNFQKLKIYHISIFYLQKCIMAATAIDSNAIDDKAMDVQWIEF